MAIYARAPLQAYRGASYTGENALLLCVFAFSTMIPIQAPQAICDAKFRVPRMTGTLPKLPDYSNSPPWTDGANRDQSYPEIESSLRDVGGTAGWILLPSKFSSTGYENTDPVAHRCTNRVSIRSLLKYSSENIISSFDAWEVFQAVEWTICGAKKLRGVWDNSFGSMLSRWHVRKTRLCEGLPDSGTSTISWFTDILTEFDVWMGSRTVPKDQNEPILRDLRLVETIWLTVTYAIDTDILCCSDIPLAQTLLFWPFPRKQSWSTARICTTQQNRWVNTVTLAAEAPNLPSLFAPARLPPYLDRLVRCRLFQYLASFLLRYRQWKGPLVGLL